MVNLKQLKATYVRQNKEEGNQFNIYDHYIFKARCDLHKSLCATMRKSRRCVPNYLQKVCRWPFKERAIQGGRLKTMKKKVLRSKEINHTPLHIESR